MISRLIRISVRCSSNSTSITTTLEDIHPLQIPKVLHAYASHQKTKILAPYFNMWAKQLQSSNVTLSTTDTASIIYGLRDIDLVTYPAALKLALFALGKCQPMDSFNHIDIAKMMCGLQSTVYENSSNNVRNVNKLFRTLEKIISNSNASFNERTSANCLYGLNSMNSESVATRSMLEALAPKISEGEDIQHGHTIGRALFGLSNKSPKHAAVRSIVTVLSEKIKVSQTTELTGQNIGNALYGLQCLSTAFPTVRKLVNELAYGIENSSAKLIDQNVGNALFGLQLLSSDFEEVQRLVRALRIKIFEISDEVELSGRGIGGIYGLRSMSDKCKEVRELVRVIAKLVRKSNCVPLARNISFAIGGLGHMSSESAEVRELLDAINNKINTNNLVFQGREFAQCLHGLRMMSSEQIEVRNLLYSVIKQASTFQFKFTSDEFVACVTGIGKMNPNHLEVERTILYLADYLRKDFIKFDGLQARKCEIIFRHMPPTSAIDQLQSLIHAGAANRNPRSVSLEEHHQRRSTVE